MAWRSSFMSIRFEVRATVSCLQADRRQGIDHAGLGVLVIQLDLDRPACGRQIEIDEALKVVEPPGAPLTLNAPTPSCPPF
jgi:hypothetical protein